MNDAKSIWWMRSACAGSSRVTTTSDSTGGLFAYDDCKCSMHSICIAAFI